VSGRGLSGSRRGQGPGLISPRGIAVETLGSLVVADVTLEAAVRVDADTGARTLLSGCTVADDAFAISIDTTVTPSHNRSDFGDYVREKPEATSLLLMHRQVSERAEEIPRRRHIRDSSRPSYEGE
jgi:hypothetical protein